MLKAANFPKGREDLEIKMLNVACRMMSTYQSGMETLARTRNGGKQTIVVKQVHVRETYAKRSDATSTKNLMDSYIRSIRWASDRIGKSGVIGFVTNAGFLESTSADGLRLCLAEEFSSI